MNSEVVLSVKNLETEFQTDDGAVQVLHGVSFDVKKGRTLGLVGESGCGKSVTSMSIMGLLPKPYGRVIGGEILYRGKDLVTLPADEMYAMRGDRISIIFQDPMTALNPVHTVGKQLMEVLKLHRPDLDRKARREQALEMLKKVRIPMPEKRLDEYPHNLSGGMRQRVMIAMALACKPEILICDEPTTALDVTVQASILELINELQEETGMAVIFITHDLGVVAEICDDVAVMYGGKIVEYADVFELFDAPKHPYTERLMGLMPSLEHEPKQLIEIKPIDVSKFPEFRG
ncbi:ABC transporter ATP-binding protein [Vibrio vulnificus]|jgi:peptide/nickel transport system ATP-binding protein|uniref:ABC-type dipeptide transporter n=5 Tax=Vibrio vulnificus TaxID=672 RepID=A0A2S3RA56_VIBVL|nr:MULTISPECIES: ABC transporter ATP-binding protein [Vibrio]EWS68915.1 peptide ABC transporter ATP-binding protein [Vibrio vulnificus BAA87]OJI60838.1 Oligopeptide transport ATP-binding protein OppD [Vibrio fluvialis]AAO11304.1 oligopeptide ABC transporter, ATP-binding protein [Vibrio vulnificus CMCP6]ADV86934.1 oligopeptide transport ATP-binding protein OppD [Vibrio vulnificus MO6-24/O]AIL70314.1 oligopeptide ABC transporter ATP-binding protein [Vibrio vulnificus]